jgi:hypothetical protein
MKLLLGILILASASVFACDLKIKTDNDFIYEARDLRDRVDGLINTNTNYSETCSSYSHQEIKNIKSKMSCLLKIVSTDAITHYKNQEVYASLLKSHKDMFRKTSELIRKYRSAMITPQTCKQNGSILSKTTTDLFAENYTLIYIFSKHDLD